jgi:hypothetical protein
VLEHWPVVPSPPGSARFTTIGTWRGPYDPILYRRRKYGLRAHEFRRFVALPALTGHEFEAALDIDPGDELDRQLLVDNGWHLVDPRSCAWDPSSYRAYVRDSLAELMVAKEIYVGTNSGWFSDRSICYLASGRPVLAEDTGIRHLYPTGSGLVPFSTPEEAATGVQAILGDYSCHARDARAIAEEYFDSDRVLTRLLDSLGTAAPERIGATRPETARWA